MFGSERNEQYFSLRKEIWADRPGNVHIIIEKFKDGKEVFEIWCKKEMLESDSELISIVKDINIEEITKKWAIFILIDFPDDGFIFGGDDEDIDEIKVGQSDKIGKEYETLKTYQKDSDLCKKVGEKREIWKEENKTEWGMIVKFFENRRTLK